MASGLFHYSDANQGYDRPEPENTFIRFWYRYAKWFFYLLRLNLLFFLISLPAYVWAMTLYNSFVVSIGMENIALMPALISYYLEAVPTAVLVIFVLASIVLTGPAWAGLMSVSGRYAQGCFAWPWADFRDAFRENFRQAAIIGVAEAVFIFVTFYYITEENSLFGAYGGIIRILWLIFMCLYLYGRVYLLPMMVSVKLPLGTLIKNSLLLALVKPLRTLFCVGIAIVLAIICSFADFVVVPFFAYSFFAFASSAITYPVMKKYLFDPAEKNQA